MWDFANLIMKYKMVGKEVELKGVIVGMDTVVSDPTHEVKHGKIFVTIMLYLTNHYP